MAIKSIMIHNIKSEYTAEYIANVLLSREIAYVSSITLIPEIKNDDIFNIAYIDINSYCDTESAYDFIESLKYEGVFILNNDPKDNPWIIQKNTHNSGGLCVGTYTTKFTYNENENWIEAEGKNEYPTFEEFKNEMAIQYAMNNSHNVTLRPHQQPYKHFQESQIFPKEMIWRSDLIRSVSDLPV